MKIAEIRKGIVAVVALAGFLATQSFVNGTAQHYLTIGIAVANAVLIYVIPNAPSAAAVAAAYVPAHEGAVP
jgi:hypothetical protein